MLLRKIVICRRIVCRCSITPGDTALTPESHAVRTRSPATGVPLLETAQFITGEVLHVDGGQIAGS
jgi:hypothetical protein